MTGTLRRFPAVLVATLAIGVGACSQENFGPVDPATSGGLRTSANRALEAQLVGMLEGANSTLAARGANVRVLKIETISGDPREAGITVLWKDVGNKRVEDDFVPGDPRRLLGSPEGGWSADPNQISFAIDQVDATTLNGVGPAITNAEIRDAMATWDDVRCADVGLHETSSTADLGFVAFLFGLGGSDTVVADYQHAGWLELEFGGATIASTFFLSWVDPVTGEPTDIDGNGLFDAAFRETYYDAVCNACSPVTFWRWEVADGVNEDGQDVDIETIALHEAGHGFSQDHFGKGFIGGDGFLHLTSDAVMAASYVRPHTTLEGPDVGGHCAIWANWPNN
jgi:hypothetical protein